MATIVGQTTVCPECATEIDPENHVYNPQTEQKYCSIDCWGEGVQ